MKRVLLAVLGAALLVNVAAGLKYGISRPMESDAYYYLQIAKSLAGGDGYVLQDGFWGNAPTMTRSPAWPFTVSLALRITPGLDPDLVMRLLAILLNIAVAGLLAALSRRLNVSPMVALMAGVIYAVHPTALYLAITGASEIVFLLMVLAGTLLLMDSGTRRWAGCLVLGLATLARANFILWAFFACLAAAVLFWRSRHGANGRRQVVVCAVALLLFLAPSLLWAVRNQRVCGHFPVLSTLRGQTFYGGNNAVVAGTMEQWGYWIFPNSVPGERPMVELARDRSEYEVDRYYFRKGLEYWRQEWFSLPRLFLGKLVRAYVPIPWKPSWGAYGLAGLRWTILVAGIAGLCTVWRELTPVFRVHLAALFLTNAATVVVFWGCARFAFALEPFLIPFVARVAFGRWRQATHNGWA